MQVVGHGARRPVLDLVPAATARPPEVLGHADSALYSFPGQDRTGQDSALDSFPGQDCFSVARGDAGVVTPQKCGTSSPAPDLPGNHPGRPLHRKSRGARSSKGGVGYEGAAPTPHPGHSL